MIWLRGISVIFKAMDTGVTDCCANIQAAADALRIHEILVVGTLVMVTGLKLVTGAQVHPIIMLRRPVHMLADRDRGATGRAELDIRAVGNTCYRTRRVHARNRRTGDSTRLFGPCGRATGVSI